MTVDRKKLDAWDRYRVAGGQEMIRQLTKYYDISIEQARDLIERFGIDRGTLYREAARVTATPKRQAYKSPLKWW